jgi:hypothetical protein
MCWNHGTSLVVRHILNGATFLGNPTLPLQPILLHGQGQFALLQMAHFQGKVCEDVWNNWNY